MKMTDAKQIVILHYIYRHTHTHTHTKGSTYREQRAGSYLLLGGKIWIDGKVYLVHDALDHVHGVGAPGLSTDSLLHHDGGDVPELRGQLRLPLLARNLELPFLQNLTEHNSSSND